MAPPLAHRTCSPYAVWEWCGQRGAGDAIRGSFESSGGRITAAAAAGSRIAAEWALPSPGPSCRILHVARYVT